VSDGPGEEKIRRQPRVAHALLDASALGPITDHQEQRQRHVRAPKLHGGFDQRPGAVPGTKAAYERD
jgi:hypothetical protein